MLTLSAALQVYVNLPSDTQHAIIDPYADAQEKQFAIPAVVSRLKQLL